MVRAVTGHGGDNSFRQRCSLVAQLQDSSARRPGMQAGAKKVRAARKRNGSAGNDKRHVNCRVPSSPPPQHSRQPCLHCPRGRCTQNCLLAPSLPPTFRVSDAPHLKGISGACLQRLQIVVWRHMATSARCAMSAEHAANLQSAHIPHQPTQVHSRERKRKDSIRHAGPSAQQLRASVALEAVLDRQLCHVESLVLTDVALLCCTSQAHESPPFFCSALMGNRLNVGLSPKRTRGPRTHAGDSEI